MNLKYYIYSSFSAVSAAHSPNTKSRLVPHAIRARFHIMGRSHMTSAAEGGGGISLADVSKNT